MKTAGHSSAVFIFIIEKKKKGARLICVSEEVPKNKYEGLTASEIEEIEGLRSLVTGMYGGDPAAAPMVEFMVEQERLWKLLVHALEKVKEERPELYYALLIAVREDTQVFWNILNNIHDASEEDMGIERLDANQHISDISDFRFSGLFTNDGFKMREKLIATMEEHPETRDIVAVLKELQKLMPELGPEDYDEMF